MRKSHRYRRFRFDIMEVPPMMRAGVVDSEDYGALWCNALRILREGFSFFNPKAAAGIEIE